MKKLQNKSTVLLILLLFAGIVLGGFIGDWLGSSSVFSWLNYGKSFGLTSPFVLDLGVMVLQFAIMVKITISSLIGFIIAAVIYRFL